MSTRRETTNVQPRSLPDTDDKLAWALFYARELNIPVFPLHETDGERCSCGNEGCGHQGKHPRWNRGDLENGVKDATLDEETIEGWWTLWPDANIGGAMGRVSGITVADADTPEVVSFLKEHAPDAPSQTTGSGMKQFFFPYDEALGLGNWQGIMGGMDIRTQGGYVVLPPSRNAEGPYRWNSLPYEKPPMPPEVLKAIRDHRKKENRVASSTSKKIGKALEGVSSGSVEVILDGIKKGFSEDEKIPVGSRHIRLLEIGGHLRRKGLRREKIELVLLWLNENLCEEPLLPRDKDRIVASVFKIQREVNDLVDEFESWLERQGDNPLFKNVSGGTNRKVTQTLLDQCRMFGVKGVEGLEVTIARLDLHRLSGVSYKKVCEVVKRLDLLSSTPDPHDLTNASTITVHYPKGHEVNEDGEVVVVPFGEEDVRKVHNLVDIPSPKEPVEEEEYPYCVPFLHSEVRSRWGGGLLGLTKEWLLNSILRNIPLGKPFRIGDLSFIDKDYNFKRSHLCGLTGEKLGRYGLVERVKKGVYVLPEDFPERYETYRVNSGEAFVEEREPEKIAAWRASWHYSIELQKAVRKGKSLEEVPVPDGVRNREGLLARARIYKESLRKDEAFFEGYAHGVPTGSASYGAHNEASPDTAREGSGAMIENRTVEKRGTDG